MKEFKTSKEMAIERNISPRSVRNYCAKQRIEGAKLIGKIWYIPANAKKPTKTFNENNLLSVLLFEKNNKIKNSIYSFTQIAFSYNSSHIEGSSLSLEDTNLIYETNNIISNGKSINVDDIVETTSHFRCFDYILDVANHRLSESIIKKLHLILKCSTSDSTKSWFNVGEYKMMPNCIGEINTSKPEEVGKNMQKLLREYNKIEKPTLEDIIDFHYRFECIHPFQDGNGRVGRLIMFKECLKNNILPFIIQDEFKAYYYRGLKEYKNCRGYLIDTIKTSQDNYELVLKK